jgi:hypothetical protein
MATLKLPVQFDFSPLIEQLQQLQGKEPASFTIPQPVIASFPVAGAKYLPGQFVKVRGHCAMIHAVSDHAVDGRYLYDAITLDGKWHLFTEEPESELVSHRYKDRPKYAIGEAVQSRGVPCVVTAISPQNPGGEGLWQLYDLITLDGSRHLYTDEPECNLKPDRTLTTSGGDA